MIIPSCHGVWGSTGAVLASDHAAILAPRVLTRRHSRLHRISGAHPSTDRFAHSQSSHVGPYNVVAPRNEHGSSLHLPNRLGTASLLPGPRTGWPDTENTPPVGARPQGTEW